MPGPQIGTVVDGYRFKGGNPNDAGAWEQVAKMSGAEQKALQEARDDSREALRIAQAAERFGKLNQKSGTGGLRAFNVPIPFTKSDFGVDDVISMFDPNFAAMRSIASSVAPGMRPEGSGSSSDRDMKMFKESFPSVFNLGSANKIIRERLVDDSTQKGARAAFLETWAQKKGTLAGGDQAFDAWWSKYSKRQPMKAKIDSALSKAKPAAKSLTWNPKTGDFDE